MTYYFSKVFNEFDLNKVEYYRCNSCGFVASKTHSEMPFEQWETLNFKAHSFYNRIEFDPKNQPPPYLQQALMLQIMKYHHFFSGNNWLDWGSGEAKLAKILDKYFSENLFCYDKYIIPGINAVKLSRIKERKFNLVINSAVFEHATNRLVLEEINDYVSTEGSLSVHTLVREEIPKDPEWFYLLPIHSAFYTNKSMEILMANWDYKCSTYCPPAKMWVFFRSDPVITEQKVRKVNASVGHEYLYFKTGFMNYWIL